jgi:perosamine synthetase
MNQSLNRRRFVAATAAAGVGLAMGKVAAGAPAAAADKPALLGGKPVKTRPFPAWPHCDALEERGMLATLRSGQWFRGGAQQVDKFETAFARLTGAKHCVATNGGTTALIAALGALGVGPGDEVIVTPYTFIASMTSIMMHFALPVFVDVDPETFLIDPRKIEAAVTDRTVAIMPVHIGGSVADMDGVLAVANKHNLPVIEDACQAHLAQWRDR